MQTNLNITGQIEAILVNEDGEIIHREIGPNLVVNAGLAFITSRMANNATAVMSHMAVGTSNAAPAAAQTALQGTELARVTLSSTTPSANQIVFSATFPAGTGTGSIAECGLFNNSPGGTMLARSTAVTVTKGATDTLIINWTITAA